MENQTRELFDKYIVRQAHLNGVSPSAVANRFSVDPTIQQKLEQAAMESDDFMKLVNHVGVKEQEGQKVKIGSKGPMASTNNSSDGTNRRTLHRTITKSRRTTTAAKPTMTMRFHMRSWTRGPVTLNFSH